MAEVIDLHSHSELGSENEWTAKFHPLDPHEELYLSASVSPKITFGKDSSVEPGANGQGLLQLSATLYELLLEVVTTLT